MLVEMNNPTIATSFHMMNGENRGIMTLEYNERDFFVTDLNRTRSKVFPTNLSKELRGISSEELQKALSAGYLAISQIGEEYAVRFNCRLAGGGLLFTTLACVGMNVAGASLIVLGTLTSPQGGSPLTSLGLRLLTSTAPSVFLSF